MNWIAGMEESLFVERMKSFRDGSLEATVMHQHAKGFNDAQIEAMAVYFSSREAR